MKKLEKVIKLHEELLNEYKNSCFYSLRINLQGEIIFQGELKKYKEKEYIPLKDFKFKFYTDGIYYIQYTTHIKEKHKIIFTLTSSDYNQLPEHIKSTIDI